MAPNNNFHPALAVSNIRNNIPLLLESENVNYATWAELFKITAKSHRVLHHIIAPEKGKEKVPLTDEEIELHAMLDATVLGWIYSTVSKPLLKTLVEPDSTAMQAWERLRKLFQDNASSGAVILEQEFTTTHMDDFQNVSDYCQKLKELSDQLRDVDAPVSNTRLVLQLIAGLSEAYNGVGTILRHRKEMPAFNDARSMLTLEEAGMNRKVGTTTAMVAQSTEPSVFSPTAASNSNGGKKAQHKNKSKNGGRNGGKGFGSGGRGGSNNGGNGGRGGAGKLQQSTPWQGWNQQQNVWGWQQQPWTAPPCPYPATQPNWARPNIGGQRPMHGQPGLLGSRPTQAHFASNPPTQTNIEAAMYTLGLTPPDPNWYMDTGATSHMTSASGFPDGDESNEM